MILVKRGSLRGIMSVRHVARLMILGGGMEKANEMSKSSVACEVCRASSLQLVLGAGAI